MPKERWQVIRVELISRPGEPIDSPPGRDFLVSSRHSLLEFAVAIDTSFARWDRGHLHLFRLSDGSLFMLGGDEDDRGVASTESSLVGSLQLEEGTVFEYVFDLGDEWTHRCEVRTVGVDPDEELGDIPPAPVALFGWGTIPDQYGRTMPD